MYACMYVCMHASHASHASDEMTYASHASHAPHAFHVYMLSGFFIMGTGAAVMVAREHRNGAMLSFVPPGPGRRHWGSYVSIPRPRVPARIAETSEPSGIGMLTWAFQGEEAFVQTQQVWQPEVPYSDEEPTTTTTTTTTTTNTTNTADAFADTQVLCTPTLFDYESDYDGPLVLESQCLDDCIYVASCSPTLSARSRSRSPGPRS